MRPTRRVVTGHDRAGKAVVLSDGAAPNAKLRQASGLTSTLLWVTDESPADLSGSADRAARDIGVAPPRSGTIFRVVDFPPTGAGLSSEAVLKAMGLADDGSGRHPLMHRTPSIDYTTVLEAEIDLLMEESEDHLAAGE